ncbi:hypothetical protein CRG98_001317 [Punica granatum]|uniref:Uncharacterized protein n=1 Tax=Punica granatum TaxID=22663 RepID=A0A2I0LC55_PUNGR|nr:hypothetical protein CRG98_001317 [Punica granatum]
MVAQVAALDLEPVALDLDKVGRFKSPCLSELLYLSKHANRNDLADLKLSMFTQSHELLLQGFNGQISLPSII